MSRTGTSWPLDTRRYLPFADKAYALGKALETYQNEYGVGYPQEERPAGRPAKTSPLYERLRAQGAMYGARGGWERAVYYARADDPLGEDCSFRRPHWHRAVARECAAVANGVAALDLPGFAKFEVSGAGAAAWLDRMIAGRLPRAGRVGLNYCCSPRGGIVTEMTVSHLADGRFLADLRRCRGAPRRGPGCADPSFQRAMAWSVSRTSLPATAR